MRTSHRTEGLLQVPVIGKAGGLASLSAPLLCRAQGVIAGVIATVAGDGPSTFSGPANPRNPPRASRSFRAVIGQRGYDYDEDHSAWEGIR
jgi:hypothetical protein